MKNKNPLKLITLSIFTILLTTACNSKKSTSSYVMPQAEKEALEKSGYQIKGEKVFYRQKEIKDCNAATFRRLGEFHWTDNKHIFWAGKRLPEADVKTFTTDNGMARDKNNVYSGDKIIVDADPLTFNIKADSLKMPKDGFTFLRDSYFIYKQRIKMADVDYETFEVLKYEDSDLKPNWWAKDKENVYWNNYIVKGADPKTITILNSGQAKDKDENYFILNKRRVKIDPSTFVNYPNKMIKSATGVYSANGLLLKDADPKSFAYLNKWYQKDANTVFYQTKKFNKADRNSFQITEHLDFAYDKDQVFFRGNPIQGIDMASWVLLSKRYSKDKDHVYFQNFPMKDADPETFEVIYVDGEAFGKDKNGKFKSATRM